jgi:hypothetical protein
MPPAPRWGRLIPGAGPAGAADGREADVDDEGARGRAHDAATRGVLVQRLAEALGGRSGVAAVFGEPVQRGEITVVPVARTRWGVGGGEGGAGPSRDAGGEGTGAGGGATSTPVGYIEITAEGARFVRIGRSPLPAILIAGGVAAWLIGRGVRGLLG